MPDHAAASLMAFDFGGRKIGVAVGQAVTGTTTGIDSVRTEPEEDRWRRIGELIRDWRPHALVVGLPMNSQGEETASSRCARRFGSV